MSRPNKKLEKYISLNEKIKKLTKIKDQLRSELIDGNEKSASRWLLALILVTGITAITVQTVSHAITPFLLGLIVFGVIHFCLVYGFFDFG